MKRIKIKDLLQSKNIGTEVVVKGWVRTRRGNKSVSFIALNDGSTIHSIQVVADMNQFTEEE
ncbi:MAG: asparagine--tRNA ligase, partial [Cytophagaceae bacterium]|nr:asparagine--tRNA ligase [Cytophagaceae bacterium]